MGRQNSEIWVWGAGAVIFIFVQAVQVFSFSHFFHFEHEIAVPQAGRQAGRPCHFPFFCPRRLWFPSISLPLTHWFSGKQRNWAEIAQTDAGTCYFSFLSRLFHFFNCYLFLFIYIHFANFAPGRRQPGRRPGRRDPSFSFFCPGGFISFMFSIFIYRAQEL